MSDIEDMKLMLEIIAAGGKRQTIGRRTIHDARLLDLGYLEASGDHDGAVDTLQRQKGKKPRIEAIVVAHPL